MEGQILGICPFAFFPYDPAANQFSPQVFPVVARLIIARVQTLYSQKSSAFRVRVRV
jgi:hypothetical protein